VDIVLERDDGMIAGIEVKASATVKASDFSCLRALAEASGIDLQAERKSHWHLKMIPCDMFCAF
jgi:hypothetical protein